MHKRATRAMLHAHRVDTIDPTRGFVYFAGSDEDALASVGAMPDSELAEERRRLMTENGRWLAEQQAARALNDARRVQGIGSTLQTIQSRLAGVNAEIKRRNMERHEKEERELMRLIQTEIGRERFLQLADQARENVSAAA